MRELIVFFACGSLKSEIKKCIIKVTPRALGLIDFGHFLAREFTERGFGCSGLIVLQMRLLA